MVHITCNPKCINAETLQQVRDNLISHYDRIPFSEWKAKQLVIDEPKKTKTIRQTGTQHLYK